MRRELITKPRSGWTLRPNLIDYTQARQSFSWAVAERQLDGLPGGAGLNIAHEALDRHACGLDGDKVALKFIDISGVVKDYSYRQLYGLTNRFAKVLKRLGVAKGERVFSLLGRVPELYVTVLGTLKAGSVFCPLFASFGPEPVHSRLSLGAARVLVTTKSLYLRRVAQLRQSLPELKHVLLIDADTDATLPPGTASFHKLLAAQDEAFVIEATDPEDWALLHFTSGTTGEPKGAVHVHAAVVAHYMTGKLALDLQSDDVFWCTADPGWVTGIAYGIIAPLTNGVSTVLDQGEFDPARWYSILQDCKVNVWYTAPTAVRMLMKMGRDLPQGYDLGSLRFVASVGEPLNPEGVFWSLEAFGLPFHDNWWQTETGSIMIANFASLDIKPGSMGKPLPGIEAALVRKHASGEIEMLDDPHSVGELALRSPWPSMFRGYLGQPESYRRSFVAGWYLSGDLARRDADSYFWFVGRADDVINSSGHLIGPFEVESVLLEHPAVAEAGVIGKPDPMAMEVVKAYVTLNPGFEGSEALNRDIRGHARKRLGAAVAPKEIEFADWLPRTRSGKIMRRLLKARARGLPEGDTSALESEH